MPIIRSPLTLAAAMLALLPIVAQAQQAGGNAAERLMQADRNGDGAIDRAELAAWKAQQWSRLDRNGDGVFSKDDLPRMMRSRWDSDRLVQMRKASDTNHDGKISRAEFLNGPTPAFDAADANHDGIVTAAEMQALKTQSGG